MNLVEALTQQNWALERRTYDNLQALVLRHASGQKLSAEVVEQIVANSTDRARAESRGIRPSDESVAVIPVQGVIAKHARQVNGSSQPRGTSIEILRNALSAALEDPSVVGIVLDVDSPGGSTAGLMEFAEDLRAARGTKPIVAHVDGLSASAAYWIAAQADEVVATRGSEIGSIGVYAPIVDDHRFYESEGIDVEVISSGGVKGAGVRGTKLTTEAREEVQTGVNQIRDFFVEAVAAGRGLEASAAMALADGRMHFAEAAVELGLIDSVGSFEDAVALAAPTTQSTARERVPATGSVMNNTHTNEAATARPETAADLAAQFPALVNEIRDEARAEGRTAGEEAGRTAEQERCRCISQAATSSQSKLAQELIASGASIPDAIAKLSADPHRESASELARRSADSGEAIDGSAEAMDDGDDDEEEEASESVEDQAKKAWRTRKDIRAEFASEETYVAYAKRKGGV